MSLEIIFYTSLIEIYVKDMTKITEWKIRYIFLTYKKYIKKMAHKVKNIKIANNGPNNAIVVRSILDSAGF